MERAAFVVAEFHPRPPQGSSSTTRRHFLIRHISRQRNHYRGNLRENHREESARYEACAPLTRAKIDVMIVAARRCDYDVLHPNASASFLGTRMSTTSPETPRPATESTDAPRPWYRQPRYLAILAVVFVAFLVWRNDTMNKVGTRHYLVGSDAPLFDLPIYDSDETFHLEDYDGKVILLDFWATWCFPCKRQVPALRSINGRYGGDDFVIIGVNTDEETPAREHKIYEYLEAGHLNVLTTLDNNRTQVLYDVQTIPTMILIGKDGKIKRVFRGLTTRSILERAIEAELQN